MKKLQYATEINAPKETIWSVLWNDDTYRKWTSVFSEGSSAETDWQEGSKIHFLNGEGGGMYSTVVRNIPNEYMSIRHLGEIKDGKEMPVSEEAESWTGSMENYTLTQNGNTTTLTVEVDAVEAYQDFFDEAFPKALEKVKDLAETEQQAQKQTEPAKITIDAAISAEPAKVWEYYTRPEHITKWNFASDDWQCPRAENDLRAGGKYAARMEAKDGSFGFDFEAVYDEVIDQKKITYTMADGRQATTLFDGSNGATKVRTTFDAETQHDAEMQRAGWQAILDNFKKYTEAN